MASLHPFKYRFALALLAVAAFSFGACGDDDTPTAPGTPTVRTTEFFVGSIGPEGSQFYSFTTGATGSTELTLVSLRPAGVATQTLNRAVSIGIGTPSGTTCAVTSAVNTSPGLTAQLTSSTTATTYCAEIHDIGNLTDTTDFTLRILRP